MQRTQTAESPLTLYAANANRGGPTILHPANLVEAQELQEVFPSCAGERSDTKDPLLLGNESPGSF